MANSVLTQQNQTVSKNQNFLELHAIRSNPLATNLIAVGMGILILALLAKVAIPLPFTPVPITGQTFGVILISLLYGRNKGFATVLGYLAIGMSGLPVFAVAGGVTVGYLIGMAFASLLVGELADRGWCFSFSKSLVAGTIGTAVIFLCGLIVLSYFLPTDKIWMAGLWPFLPGAVVKVVLASSIASGIYSIPKS